MFGEWDPARCLIGLRDHPLRSDCRAGSLSPAWLFLHLAAPKTLPKRSVEALDRWIVGSKGTSTAPGQARFGIGDVYFCALSWGKLEVIEERTEF